MNTKCLHNKGYLFTIDYRTDVGWSGTYTADVEESECYLNRYCKVCRQQMGYTDLGGTDFNLVEFQSKEISNWFKKRKA